MKIQYQERGFVPASDGTPLYYETTQKRDNVIILSDGIGCNGFAWRHLAPLLQQNFQIVHWHYKGHGESGIPLNWNQTDVASLGKDLHLVLDHLDIEKAILIGHSMGTQVSLEAYRKKPVRIQSLILICGSYGRITHTFHGTDILHRVLPILRETVNKQRHVAQAFWKLVSPKLAFKAGSLLHEIDELALKTEDFNHYWSHLTTMDLRLFLHMLASAGEHNAADFLSEIQAPTLIVAGDQDTFTPVKYSEFMAKQIPNAELMMIPGGRHTAPVEQPELIHTKIENFLKKYEIKNPIERAVGQ